MNAVETQALTKHYGEVRALTGLDLTVPTGTIFGFLGPNGAGKTTAIRILVGLLRATAGSATVLGRRAWGDAPDICRRVGYLPGDARFHDWMTGKALLAFFDRARGGGTTDEAARLRERFGLDVSRRIRDYSRGMKQKLGLILALMHRPELLILDEPATGLDPLVQQTLYEELRAVAAEGRTVLFSSHTLNEVEQLCERVGIIRQGRLIENSTIAELRSRALRRVTFRLRDAALRDLAYPPGLTAGPVDNGVVTGTWRGPMDRLLGWLAGLDVDDAMISPPSLEDLFTAYYREESAEADNDSISQTAREGAAP
jgi:ABC-2 type transport system ATP-binding protein